MGKKRNKKLPYRAVRDLPIGEGVIILRTKKGRTIEVDGKAINLSDGKKHLLTKGNNRNSVSLSFGSGTIIVDIKKWRPEATIGRI